MAVFMSTPSAPNSMAMAASDAVPTPASTMIGTRDHLAHDAHIGGVLHAQPRTDGRGQRHHRGGAGVDQLLRLHQVVVGVRQHDEAFLHQHARGFEQPCVVREQGALVADDLQLDPVGKPTSRASRAVLTASSAV